MMSSVITLSNFFNIKSPPPATSAKQRITSDGEKREPSDSADDTAATPASEINYEDFLKELQTSREDVANNGAGEDLDHSKEEGEDLVDLHGEGGDMVQDKVSDSEDTTPPDIEMVKDDSVNEKEKEQTEQIEQSLRESSDVETIDLDDESGRLSQSQSVDSADSQKDGNDVLEQSVEGGRSKATLAGYFTITGSKRKGEKSSSSEEATVTGVKATSSTDNELHTSSRKNSRKPEKVKKLKKRGTQPRKKMKVDSTTEDETPTDITASVKSSCAQLSAASKVDVEDEGDVVGHEPASAKVSSNSDCEGLVSGCKTSELVDSSSNPVPPVGSHTGCAADIQAADSRCDTDSTSSSQPTSQQTSTRRSLREVRTRLRQKQDMQDNKTKSKETKISDSISDDTSAESVSEERTKSTWQLPKISRKVKTAEVKEDVPADSETVVSNLSQSADGDSVCSSQSPIEVNADCDNTVMSQSGSEVGHSPSPSQHRSEVGHSPSPSQPRSEVGHTPSPSQPSSQNSVTRISLSQVRSRLKQKRAAQENVVKQSSECEKSHTEQSDVSGKLSHKGAKKSIQVSVVVMDTNVTSREEMSISRGKRSRRCIAKSADLESMDITDDNPSQRMLKRSSRQAKIMSRYCDKEDVEQNECTALVRKSSRSRRVKGRVTDDSQRVQVEVLDDSTANQRASPVMINIGVSSADDDHDVLQKSSSATAKRLQKKTILNKRKKRKVDITELDAKSDDEVLVVAEVASPSTALRKERLERLHAMSTRDDYANLRQVTKAKPRTQAELFPRIGHVTQLPQTTEEYECGLRLLSPAATADTIQSRHDRLSVGVVREEPPSAHRLKKEKISNCKIKRELKKLSTLLPHYPTQDVYDSLDSRVTSGEVDERLWTHKYSPTTLTQLLVGKGCVEVINEWLLNWKRDIISGLTSSKRKRSKKKSKRKRDQFIDDDESEESDTEWTKTPILVISGKSGLGKTTCAYTIASLLGYKVFEINPSMLRTTKTVMEKVHESTQSQQVQKGKGISIEKMFDRMAQAESKPSSGISSFFTKMKQKKLEKEKEVESKQGTDKEKTTPCKAKANNHENTETEEDAGEERVTLTKLSLILFDEADVVFEDDKGFYDSVRTLGLQAKKPIILTCQSTDFLRTLGVPYSHVEITPHVNSEVAAYLCLISLVEQEVADFQAMLALVNKYKCDIRKGILQVQYLISSGGLHNDNLAQQKSKPKKKIKETTISPLQNLARISHHQTSLDIINRHHCSKHSSNYTINNLSSNKSQVFVEKGMLTSVTSDPVLWSSVYHFKSTYTELLKNCFSLPQSSSSSFSSLDIPLVPLVMSIREELPPYCIDISDSALSLDLLSLIQTVCIAEKERKSMKISRRFLHYMDKIGLYMSEEDKSKVTQIFQCKQRIKDEQTTPVEREEAASVNKSEISKEKEGTTTV